MGDNFAVSYDPRVIGERIQKLARAEYTQTQLDHDFALGKNYADFILKNASKTQFDANKIVPIDYRPFDTRYTYFDNKVIWRWREDILYIYHENGARTVNFNSINAKQLIRNLKSEPSAEATRF